VENWLVKKEKPCFGPSERSVEFTEFEFYYSALAVKYKN
jgi:hypothetical protein